MGGETSLDAQIKQPNQNLVIYVPGILLMNGNTLACQNQEASLVQW